MYNPIVTFTGLDEKTNLSRLVELQEKYPLIEFGFLVSLSRSGTFVDNRYPMLDMISELRYLPINLSLHVCGTLANNVLEQGFHGLAEFIGKDFRMFKRIQLNGVYKVIYDFFLVCPDGVEVILQHNQSYPPILNRVDWSIGKVSILVDNSGGRGVAEKFKLYSPNYGIRVGYAGGINPDNVKEKIQNLKDINAFNYWIDMESGVRTNDWFDLDKVEQVCKAVFNE